MLRYFIGKVHDRFPFIPRPRVIIGVPSGVTEVETFLYLKLAKQTYAWGTK